MTTYTLDIDAAKQADTGSGRINETGKYTGVFTKAKKVESTKGTQGIELSFQADNGQSADYLTLWTINGEGKQIYGFKQLQALMTCLKLRNIESKVGLVDEYDRDAREVIQVEAEIFPGLMNAPIGLLIQMEEYQKKSGEIAQKPSIAGFFDAQTEQVAVEILEKRSPEVLTKLIGQLVEVRKLKGASQSSPASHAPQSAGFSGMDDDIPF